jgi:hypothetical protein
MDATPGERSFPPLDRRYFGIAIEESGEPVLTPVRTTVEAAVKDLWDLPSPTGDAGWSILSIDHTEEELRVERVSDFPPTDEVAEAARRIAAGEGTEEDWRFFGGEGLPPIDELEDL